MVSTQHVSQVTTGMHVRQNCTASTGGGSGSDAFTSGGSGRCIVGYRPFCARPSDVDLQQSSVAYKY